MSARTFAIGDIHGCDVALDVLLQNVAPAVGDTLIVLGDIIDRGPGSRQAIERLMSIESVCRLEMVLGNHEEMLLVALRRGGPGDGGGITLQDWLHFGGSETLASYGGDLNAIPPEHLEFLARGRNYLETDRDLYIHANLEPGIPLERQSAYWLRWTHLTGFEQPLESEKRIVCGHTPQRSGRPLVLPGWICIDTLAFGGGWLTALDVETGEVFQANQRGQYRTSWV